MRRKLVLLRLEPAIGQLEGVRITTRTKIIPACGLVVRCRKTWYDVVVTSQPVRHRYKPFRRSCKAVKRSCKPVGCKT